MKTDQEVIKELGDRLETLEGVVMDLIETWLRVTSGRETPADLHNQATTSLNELMKRP